MESSKMQAAPGDLHPLAADRPRIFSRQRVLLELVTFLYFIAKNSMIPLAQQYVYQLVARKYNYTAYDAGTAESCSLYDAEQAALRAQVNEDSSLIVLYLNIAELLPSAIIVIFLGCYSDMTGKRKFLMWLPCLGNAIYAIGFLLPAYIYGGEYSTGAVIIMVTSTIMCGLSGNIPGFFAGNATYISDTDSRERRTLRLAIVEFTVGFTFGVSNLGLGFWVNAAGFVPSLWFVFACSILPLLVIVIFVNEPDTSDRIRNPTIQDVKSIRHICGFSTISQRKLWAMFFAFQIYVFVQQGQERTYVPFLEHYPFCWGSIGIGIFLFSLYFLSGLGAWPAVPLLHRCGVGDVAIFIIAVISKALGSLLLGYATNDILIYISCVAQVFHLTPFAVGRSLVSQQVGVDEQGTVYGLVHSAQSVVSFLGPVVLNAIFYATSRQMVGSVFLISAVLLVLPLILLGCIKYLEKKEQAAQGAYVGIDTRSESEMLTPVSETSSLVQPK